MKYTTNILQIPFLKRTFHQLEPILKSMFPRQVESLYRFYRYRTSDAPFRACHLQELFVRHNGDIYPCCRAWHDEPLRIGNLSDSPDELREKLLSLQHHYCLCKKYRLRSALKDEEPQIDFLHLELSLVCQADCAMCCVEAPSWKGRFDQYDALSSLIRRYKPRRIEVQGGEVLIQKKSLEWIRALKKEHPELVFSIVTNGHVDLDMLKDVEELFETVTVSIVGFQAETYQKVMGLDFEKTRRFVEELIARKRVKVAPYYLVTPSTIHEADVFLAWAVKMLPERIRFADAFLADYIHLNAPYRYWEKIFQRSSEKMKSILVEHQAVLLERQIKIEMDSRIKKFFAFTDEFIAQHGLEQIIVCDEL